MNFLPEYKDIEAQIVDLENQHKALVYNTQVACLHELIGETDYLPMDYMASLPPLRLCLHCGLTEQGWGVGHKVLNTEYPVKLTREKVYSLRRGKALGEEEKCQLLREEKTLEEILSG